MRAENGKRSSLFTLRSQNKVPGTGFEPAHPCERCDLNTVRLPISPPGHLTDFVFQGCKDSNRISINKTQIATISKLSL